MKQKVFSLLLTVVLSSCAFKGMYVSKNNPNVPLPVNLSFMTKSDYDSQNVTGPGYTYNSVTVKHDETVIPSKGISWWGWSKVAKAVSNSFSDWSNDNAATKALESNNATRIASEKIAAKSAAKAAETAVEVVPVQ